MNKHIVVIGGGITGLAAAFEAKVNALAQQANLDITVLEQAGRLGGKIRSHQTKNFVVEAGPDSIYTRKPGGLELISELGLESELVYSPAHTNTAILRKQRLHPLPPGMTFGLPTNLRAFVFNSLIPWQGKLRGLKDFYLPADTDTSDCSIGSLLRRRIGNQLVDILAEPMIAGIHAGRIDRLSTDAVAPYLRRMEQEHGSLIRAMLKQGKNSAQSHGKTRSGDGDPPRGAFVSFANGLQQLVDTLVAKLQPEVTLQTHTTVVKIEKRQRGQFEITLRDNQGAYRKLDADAVLLCIPTHAAEKLIPVSSKVYSQLSKIPYVSTGAVSLVYPIQAKSCNLPFTGFLVPRGEDDMLTACTVVSSKWPKAARSGNIIVRGYVGRDGDESAMQKSDEAVIGHMKQQMRAHFGLTEEPVWSHVDRWPSAMPQYLVGHNDRIRQIKEQLAVDVPGMYLAGAGYNGMGIPDCISQGRAAMKSCLTDFVSSETPVTLA